MHKPDEAVAQDKGGNFECHSEGQHPVLCVDVVNLGPRVEQFQNNPAREVNKVALVFASGETNEDGSLRLIVAEMTNSMGEKARLRALLESWRGRKYKPEVIEEGVPLHKLYGQPGLLTVEHIITKAKQRKFAQISSLIPLPKVMPAPDPELLERYTRPEFFAKKKEEYRAAVAKFRAEAHGAQEEPEPEYPGDEPEDDLPF